MPAPSIVNAERIPQSTMQAMAATWSEPFFQARPIRLVEYEDVYLCAEGLLLRDDLTPVEPTIQQHPPADLVAARDAIERRRISGEPFPTLHDDLLLCRKPGATNYGHWMVELLPRYWLASKTLGKALKVLVQDVPNPLHQVMIASLAHLGAKPGDIIRTGRDPVFLPRVVCVEGLTHHGTYMSPLVLDCLDRIPRTKPTPFGKRLLVLRGAARSRRFAREQRLIQQLARKGFQPIDPCTLPFHDQVAAFANAEQIVGAMGAALTNIAFCRSGTSVTMLSPENMPDTFFWFLAGLKRLWLDDVRCPLTGPLAGPSPWDRTLHVGPQSIDEHTARAKPKHLPLDPKQAGRRVLARFDSRHYLSANPDVAAAAMNPLEHYLKHGWREGRIPTPDPVLLSTLKKHARPQGPAPLITHCRTAP